MAWLPLNYLFGTSWYFSAPFLGSEYRQASIVDNKTMWNTTASITCYR